MSDSFNIHHQQYFAAPESLSSQGTQNTQNQAPIEQRAPGVGGVDKLTKGLAKQVIGGEEKNLGNPKPLSEGHHISELGPNGNNPLSKESSECRNLFDQTFQHQLPDEATKEEKSLSAEQATKNSESFNSSSSPVGENLDVSESFDAVEEISFEFFQQISEDFLNGDFQGFRCSDGEELDIAEAYKAGIDDEAVAWVKDGIRILPPGVTEMGRLKARKGASEEERRAIEKLNDQPYKAYVMSSSQAKKFNKLLIVLLNKLQKQEAEPEKNEVKMESTKARPRERIADDEKVEKPKQEPVIVIKNEGPSNKIVQEKLDQENNISKARKEAKGRHQKSREKSFEKVIEERDELAEQVNKESHEKIDKQARSSKDLRK